jgi:spermidine synthase
MTKNEELVFNDNNIMLKSNNNYYVMMDWETELMSHHAKIVTKNKGNILEIGFGMGISAQAIQDYGCKTHTIVESHPQILEMLRLWAIDKENVIIIEGDWFVLKNEILKRKYDGIWYDADCNKMILFKNVIVDECLKKGGIFTYFDPKGNDRYGYGNSLILDSVKITTEIPKNQYHNEKHCFCPYVVKF